MKASINEIKKELNNLEASDLLTICMRLAKYKKENKELLAYLLFESHNEHSYILKVKTEIDEQFDEINKANLYWAKKSLRKILRNTNKFIKYSGQKETEVELLIYYCSKLKLSGIKFYDSPALMNLYSQQIKKIDKILSSLHEDLRYDYEIELQKLISEWD